MLSNLSMHYIKIFTSMIMNAPIIFEVCVGFITRLIDPCIMIQAAFLKNPSLRKTWIPLLFVL